MNLIRVLLVDDHPIVLDGIVALLGKADDISVVGRASDGDEAVKLARELDPEIIVMDIAMRNKDGLHAARILLEENRKRRVIILSMLDDMETIRQAVHAGIKGYLVKETASGEILTAIREIHQGNAYFSPKVANILLALQIERQNGPDLTLREREVLQLVAEAKSNKEISIQLKISTKTVEKYRQQLMDKLGIHDAVSLTRYAISRGISRV